MIIIITGALGFIGSAIINTLCKDKSNQLIGIDCASECKNELLTQYFKCDIASETDVGKLSKLVPRCDVLIHVAAKISFDNLDLNLLKVNCIGTLQMGRFALETGVKQIIYVSSIPVIKEPVSTPVTEENQKENPSTLYHITKYTGEMILKLPIFKNVSVCILRLSAPIAPSMPQNRMLPLFMKKAMEGKPITLNGKGTRVQNYIDIRDIGSAISCAIEKAASGLYLVGGQSLSNNEIAMLCNDICGSRAGMEYSNKPDPEDDYCWIVSNEKCFKQLGYSPVYKIEDTLLEMKALMDRRIE